MQDSVAHASTVLQPEPCRRTESSFRTGHFHSIDLAGLPVSGCGRECGWWKGRWSPAVGLNPVRDCVLLRGRLVIEIVESAADLGDELRQLICVEKPLCRRPTPHDHHLRARRRPVLERDRPRRLHRRRRTPRTLEPASPTNSARRRGAPQGQRCSDGCRSRYRKPKSSSAPKSRQPQWYADSNVSRSPTRPSLSRHCSAPGSTLRPSHNRNS